MIRVNSRIVTALWAAAALATVPASGAARWAHSVTVTVAGCTAQAPVQGVPVPVRIGPSSIAGFSYDAMEFPASGRDLLFTGMDGTVYPHEIDTWNPSGESLVWVLVPELFPGLAFKMLWGNGAAEASDVAAVWSGYAGVWHLNGDAADSTGASAAGQLHANTVATNGCFGAALARNDASGRNGAIALVPASSALDVAPSFSFSLWAKVFTDSIDYGYLLTRKADADTDRAWGLQFENSTYASMRVYSAWNKKNTAGTTFIGSWSNWKRFDVTYSGDATQGWTMKLFVNGELKETFDANVDEPFDGESALAIGGMAGGGHGTLKGGLDEVRLCRTARSDAWIAASYEAESTAGYLSFGAVETAVTGREFLYHAEFTPSAEALGDAVLTNFPVLVRVSPQAIRAFSYAQCAADGSDIRFVSPDGALLDFDLDTWNIAGESAFWVELPRVSATEGAFTMYWGARNAGSLPQASGNAWSAGDYASVLHLDVAEGYATTDAAGGFSGFSFVNPDVSMVGAEGLVGGAYVSPDRSQNRAIQLPSEDSKAMERAIHANGGVVTFSAWVHNDGGNSSNYGMVLNTCAGGVYGSTQGIEFGLEGNPGLFTVTDNSPSRRTGVACTDLSVGWHLVTLSYAVDGVTVFIVGLEVSGLAGTAPYVGTIYWEWVIGARRGSGGDAACSWVGGIDEFRVRLAETSAARARAEFLNVGEGTLYSATRAHRIDPGTVFFVK